MTSQMYYSEVLDSQTPWILSFVKRNKSMEHLVHSEELYGALQLLADEYYGKVRFAIVDSVEEEFLKLSFDVYTVPQTFFFKDGQVYEMQVLSIFYDNVRSFIEKNHLNETYVYKQFPAPRWLVNFATLYPHYAYRDGLKYWNKNNYDVWDYFVQNNYTESYPQIQQFFDLDVRQQYHSLLGLALMIILCTLVMCCQWIRLLRFFFCSKAAEVPEIINEINKQKVD